MKEFLDLYDNQIKEKKLTYRQKEGMDHNQFMQQCRFKFNQLSNEGDIYKLNSYVLNRITFFIFLIKNEIEEIENKIKHYIQKINITISEFQNGTSKYNENQIYKIIQYKEEMKKLGIKLKVSIDENDIMEIKNELKSIIKQINKYY